MMTTDDCDALAAAWHDEEPDAVSHAALAAQGLDLRIDATGDLAAYAPWLQAATRGFLEGDRSQTQIDASFERAGFRRRVGVYDDSGPVPEMPVATLASSISRLSVPGERDLPTCAISAVTVAPTHRRRGIARALLEGELRGAAAHGVPIASLAVSESTIYGRWGFGTAALAATWRLDTKRAAWIGPRPGGRVDFITRQTARDVLPGLHEAARRDMPGEVERYGAMWDALTGTRPDANSPERVRAVRYADESGRTQGAAVYTAEENPEDFTKSTVRISALIAATDDAYAALWRFFVEHDLIGEVRASELSVDEPLRWMISDQRAAQVTVTDHHYVRVIDVAAALGARSFSAPGVLELEIDDPLGLATGRYRLEVAADGRGAVTRAGSPDPAAVTLQAGVAELSMLYLGGVAATTLAAAGRIRSSDPVAAGRMLGWHVPARLSYWY